MWWTRFFYNPYRACRKYWEPKLRFSHHGVYGETPISTLARIASFAELKPEDIWLELGSGRGIGCAWVADAIGCSSIGIEGVPSLYWFSQGFCRRPRVSFLRGNFLEVPWPHATFIYAYTTVFRNEELKKLAELASRFLPEGGRIVTISSPLPSCGQLTEVASFPVSYPWGTTEAYVHVKKIL